MGLLDSIARVGLAVGTGGASEILPFVANKLDGNDQAQSDLDKYQNDAYGQREATRTKQNAYVDQMQGPSVSPQMEARLKALEDESKPGPLVSDPYFQGARSTMVQGGQAALSGVDNRHAVNNTTGGFRNQGSIADVYDRLGAQLSQLGQHSQALKDQKAQTAASARQAILDHQIEFENSKTKARMAIESGDSAAAMAAINQAYNARNNMLQAQRQMEASLLSAGASVASHSSVPAANYSQQPTMGGGGGGGGGGDFGSIPSADSFDYASDMPYSLM
jgi:hypothetical protein